MRLVHISDPHVIDWNGATWRQFANKRLAGGINFALFRKEMHRFHVLEKLVRDIASVKPDHVVVTGDITSLSFATELERFGDLLQSAGLQSEQVSLIPGNHDAYLNRVWIKRRTLMQLGRYSTSDLSGGMPGYPFVRLRGPLAIIGLNSAIPRPWFFASGRVGRDQLSILRALLRALPVRKLFPVILLHHPPLSYPSWVKEVQAGLMDKGALIDVLRDELDGRDGLVLSGHWHRRLRTKMPLPGKVELLVAPSASHSGGPQERVGSYHILHFEQDGSGQTLLQKVEVRGFDEGSGSIVNLDDLQA